jgi:SAM-dependent methyltransferase
MGLLKKFFAQTRKPEGFLGKLMVGGMNGGGHARLADWGLSHLDGSMPGQIAELGCGGGRNAKELLRRYPGAKLTALDYSEVSVEKTKKTNKSEIDAGRCAVVQGSVAELPFAEGQFELATAFETVYFWPGLEKCFVQVAKALKPGGLFMICNESDGIDPTSLKYEKIIDGMKNYTPQEIEAALKAAGFSEVEIDHHPTKPWIAVLARK